MNSLGGASNSTRERTIFIGREREARLSRLESAICAAASVTTCTLYLRPSYQFLPHNFILLRYLRFLVANWVDQITSQVIFFFSFFRKRITNHHR